MTDHRVAAPHRGEGSPPGGLLALCCGGCLALWRWNSSRLNCGVGMLLDRLLICLVVSDSQRGEDARSAVSTVGTGPEAVHTEEIRWANARSSANTSGTAAALAPHALTHSDATCERYHRRRALVQIFTAQFGDVIGSTSGSGGVPTDKLDSAQARGCPASSRARTAT